MTTRYILEVYFPHIGWEIQTERFDLGELEKEANDPIIRKLRRRVIKQTEEDLYTLEINEEIK